RPAVTGQGGGAPTASPPGRPTVAEVSGELRRFTGHEDMVWSVAFSPDGQTILSGGGDKLQDGRWRPGSDNTVRLWDVNSGHPRQCSRARTRHGRFIRVAFASDGHQVLGASLRYLIHRWEAQTGTALPGFAGESPQTFLVADFSADGRRVLSSSHGTTLRLSEVDTGRALPQFQARHPEAILSVAFGPEDRRAAVGGGGKVDGEGVLQPGSDYTIRLWNLETTTEQQVFRGHKRFVWALAFSHDGRRLLSGSADSTLRLWDVGSGEEIQHVERHEGPVLAVAFCPDGRLLSGGTDKTIRLWDAKSGRELRRFRGHTGEVRCLACSPDGHYALSGGVDATVRLWQLPDP